MGRKKLIYIPLLIGAGEVIVEKIVKSGLRMGYGGGRVPWRFHLICDGEVIWGLMIIEGNRQKRQGHF
jgi:hypothetical protein